MNSSFCYNVRADVAYHCSLPAFSRLVAPLLRTPLPTSLAAALTAEWDSSWQQKSSAESPLLSRRQCFVSAAHVERGAACLTKASARPRGKHSCLFADGASETAYRVALAQADPPQAFVPVVDLNVCRRQWLASDVVVFRCR